MKTQATHGPLMGAIVSMSLLAMVGSAGAQTLYFQNAGSTANAAAGGGTYGGSLSDVGFDASLWNRSGSVTSDTGGVATRPDVAGPGVAYDINLIAPNLMSFAPAGTQLESITFYLYATVINLDGDPVDFSVYSGTQSSLGSFIQTLSLTGPDDENAFFALTVTGDQFANGIAITSDGLPISAQLNIASELNTLDGGAYTPGISATFVTIPEPSVVLLGSIGLLALARRRRVS